MIKIEKNFSSALKNWRFIDLFSGIGAFNLALESFGAKRVFSCDIDRNANKIYYDNFRDIPSGDIKKIQAKDIPDHDILCAGFPCQSFSISGKMKGFEDPRGVLFFDIARIADEKKTKILILENVKHLARLNNGKVLKDIIQILENIGYQVFFKILNSAFFGLPQKRERIFFVCVRNDYKKISKFDFPDRAAKFRILKDILENRKDLDNYIIQRKDIFLFKDKIEQLTLFKKKYLKPIKVGIINKGGQGERIYHPSGTAITLSSQGGGAASKTGAYYVDGLVRKLTPRECARLMGFPDDFKLDVSDNIAYKLIGNSAPVDVIQYIAIEIIKQIIDNN